MILISADTLRADRLGCYDYAKPTSPYLDQLASESLFFENAYSQANSTNPSHASMFTSLYVSSHGILGNQGYALSPEARTIGEIFREAGYQTAGFTSVHHLNLDLNGLDQGFEFVSGVSAMTTADQTNQRVLDWLRKRRDRKPLFLFIHYFDTHTPYTPPQSYIDTFYSDNSRDPAHRSMQAVRLQPDQIASFGSWLDGVTDVEFVKASYDGAILFLNDQIQALAGELSRMGLWENTIVVFTADHGESLDEHGIYFGHLGLYEPSIRIPLMIRVPAMSPQVIRTPVQSVDILPTLLALIGQPPSPSFEGKSLLDLIGPEGEEVNPDRPVHSEHAHAAVVCLRKGSWKYLYPVNPYNQLAEVEELYHLESDPDESTNLAESDPDRAEAMRGEIRQWLETRRAGALTPIAREPSQQLIERLRALGYVK